MRIYVSTRFADRPVARAVAANLALRGHLVVSTWHNHAWTDQDAREIDADTESSRVLAERNYGDLRIADTIVVLPHADCRSTWVELAIAYHSGARCVVIGKPIDVPLMIRLGGVVFVPTVAAALDYLDQATAMAA